VAKITFSTEVPELLTFSEAAELLGMSRPNLYNLIDTGRLHRINIGNSGYVLRVEVEGLKNGRNLEARLRDLEMEIRGVREEIKQQKNNQAEATTTPA
jgi:excisionase family DNA binding protein